VEYAGEREKYTYSRMMPSSGDDEDMFHPLANRVRDSENQGHHTIMRPEKELAVRVEDVQQLEQGQIALISGGKGGFAQVHPLAIPDQLIQAAASFLRSAPKFAPLPPPAVPPGQPKQGHKKKIAASPQQPKKQQGQQAPGPGTKQKPAAAPVSPAAGQPSNNSGKRAFPQTASGQGTPQQQPGKTQGPAQKPNPAAAATPAPSPAPSPSPQKPTTGGPGQGGQQKKTGGQDDDDVIDFYS